MKIHRRGAGQLAVKGREQQHIGDKMKRLPYRLAQLFKRGPYQAGLLAAALAAGAASTTVLAQAPAAAQAEPVALTVDVGTQQLLREKDSIRRVAVAAPEIADVSVINSRELLVSGKSTGVTSLLIWTRDAKAPPLRYKVSVASRSIGGSTADLLTHRDAVLAAGGSGAVAASGGGGGAGSGGGSAPQTVADHTTVAVNTQVMSQVKIVDIQRTALQEFGVNFAGHNSAGTTFGMGPPGTIGSVTASSNGGTITSSTGSLPISSAFNLVYASSAYLGALSILESQGLAHTLAEPSLTAMSGQTASFLAGGEFPFPTVQNGGGTGNNSITIVFKEFGIRLNLTPTVLATNRIALKVAPEVSNLDYTNGISINGFTIPGLDVRRTDTTVELGDGETFVLSGLISSSLINNVSKVPWIGDVPVLGAFFRNTSVNRSDRELIMVVTPHLVRPINKDAPLPELPGAALVQYRPSFAHTMFMETGDFGQPKTDQGYSR
jgi:pilus assembly protein CpaC